jgi:hypothetical protein
MPYEIQLEENEELIGHFAFSLVNNSNHIHFGVTNRAIFLSRQKTFAVKDPTYFERIDLHQVVDVRVEKLKPYALWVLSSFLMIVGSITTASMIMPLLQGESTKISGYPPAIVVVGIVIPFIIRRRYGLTVNMVTGTYKWKPPLMVDQASRNKVDQFLNQIANACQKINIQFSDEREFEPAPQIQEPLSKNFPIAQQIEPSQKPSGVVRTCFHCGSELCISRWDDWNGFLYLCPYCKRVNGEKWNAFAVCFMGLIINFLSFFFIMRPKKALICATAFFFYWCVSSYAIDKYQIQDNYQLVLMGIGFLGPMTINAVMLIKHQLNVPSAH